MSEFTNIMNTTEQKKQKAISDVLELILARVMEQQMSMKTFSAQDSEYEITCGSDCVVGEAQLLLDISRKILIDSREKGDYFEEVASAKITSLLESWHGVSIKYAEFDRYHPEQAKMISKIIPAFATLSQHGNDTFKKLFNDNKHD